ncbi:MAG: hypothetical protein ACERKZ_20675 [Lachnotalea sp.]
MEITITPKEFINKYYTQLDKMLDIYLKDLKKTLTENALLTDLVSKFEFDSVKILVIMQDKATFNMKATNQVYYEYVNYCKQMEYEPMNKIHFSKFVNKWFGYTIISKKVNGNKRQVFIKLSE